MEKEELTAIVAAIVFRDNEQVAVEQARKIISLAAEEQPDSDDPPPDFRFLNGPRGIVK